MTPHLALRHRMAGGMRPAAVAAIVLIALALLTRLAQAHGVADSDAAFVRTGGRHVLAFFYLGAKHMVTGVDHLLFLFGIVMLLDRASRIVAAVTAFSLGHSATLLAAAWGGWRVDPSLVDAAIGFSVAYMAFDAIGGVEALFGRRPNVIAMVFLFGLVHGLGLASRLQELSAASPARLANLLGFNLGVEAGQLAALLAMLAAIGAWRASASFQRARVVAGGLIMIGGVVLMETQLAAWSLAEGGPR
ncbi:HupE/UreJ family protein [Alsobacter sp. SYSU M60028]|uniref:HupE/UreJ family protein n=1 Tax=Alsobacter ponti TaxID=2962936 RepID=A0ABT1L860_9HYPH|nr:HupE/UreJ family protein [Alsobacter ponti]